MQRKATVAGLSALLMAAGASADWHTIDLGYYTHGRVLDGETIGPATARAVNFHHADSRLVAFDTRQRDTRDPDLEGPNGDPLRFWAKGNIDPGAITGNVLILQDAGPSFAGTVNSSPRAAKAARAPLGERVAP